MRIKPKKVKLNMMICPNLKEKAKKEASKRDLSLSQLLAIGLKKEIKNLKKASIIRKKIKNENDFRYNLNK
jgi:hypothetical protein